MKHTLGDGPIQSEYEQLMNRIAKVIDASFNGEASGTARNGRCNYISNAERRDVVIMLKEQLKCFEGQPNIKGRA